MEKLELQGRSAPLSLRRLSAPVAASQSRIDANFSTAKKKGRQSLPGKDFSLIAPDILDSPQVGKAGARLETLTPDAKMTEGMAGGTFVVSVGPEAEVLTRTTSAESAGLSKQETLSQCSKGEIHPGSPEVGGLGENGLVCEPTQTASCVRSAHLQSVSNPERGTSGSMTAAEGESASSSVRDHSQLGKEKSASSSLRDPSQLGETPTSDPSSSSASLEVVLSIERTDLERDCSPLERVHSEVSKSNQLVSIVLGSNQLETNQLQTKQLELNHFDLDSNQLRSSQSDPDQTAVPETISQWLVGLKTDTHPNLHQPELQRCSTPELRLVLSPDSHSSPANPKPEPSKGPKSGSIIRSPSAKAINPSGKTRPGSKTPTPSIEPPGEMKQGLVASGRVSSPPTSPAFRLSRSRSLPASKAAVSAEAPSNVVSKREDPTDSTAKNERLQNEHPVSPSGAVTPRKTASSRSKASQSSSPCSGEAEDKKAEWLQREADRNCCAGPISPRIKPQPQNRNNGVSSVDKIPGLKAKANSLETETSQKMVALSPRAVQSRPRVQSPRPKESSISPTTKPGACARGISSSQPLHVASPSRHPGTITSPGRMTSPRFLRRSDSAESEPGASSPTTSPESAARAEHLRRQTQLRLEKWKADREANALKAQRLEDSKREGERKEREAALELKERRRAEIYALNSKLRGEEERRVEAYRAERERRECLSGSSVGAEATGTPVAGASGHHLAA